MARAVCHAGCLPRKELYEAWETARRVRRLFRGGRIVDLGAGHGLLAQILLLLDDSSPAAVVVDKAVPTSAAKLHAALVEAWPRLAGRVTFVTSALEDVEIRSGDLVVSCHACGSLTDLVLDRAARRGARVAVLPCCHDLATCDAGDLAGWVDGPAAIDIMRAVRLGSAAIASGRRRFPPTLRRRTGCSSVRRTGTTYNADHAELAERESCGGQSRRTPLESESQGPRCCSCIIERFKNGDASRIRALPRSWGMAPEGLGYLSSWVDTKLARCFQVMETDDPALIDRWMANWYDLTDFEVIPVVTSKEAADSVLGVEAPHASAATFGGVTPVFRVRNIGESIDYYLNVLGFTLDFRDPGTFASVSRGHVAIFLAEGDQGQPGTWVWIGVSDVERLFDEYQRKGAKIRQPPTNFQWACEMQVEGSRRARAQNGVGTQTRRALRAMARHERRSLVARGGRQLARRASFILTTLEERTLGIRVTSICEEPVSMTYTTRPCRAVRFCPGWVSASLRSQPRWRPVPPRPLSRRRPRRRRPGSPRVIPRTTGWIRCRASTGWSSIRRSRRASARRCSSPTTSTWPIRTDTASETPTWQWSSSCATPRRCLRTTTPCGRRYGTVLAQRSNIIDPKTGQAPKVNINKASSPQNQGVTLDSLIGKGMHVAVCQMATRRVAGMIAQATGGAADAVYNELVANLIGNAHMVAAGILAVNRAQERGYSFASIGV